MIRVLPLLLLVGVGCNLPPADPPPADPPATKEADPSDWPSVTKEPYTVRYITSWLPCSGGFTRDEGSNRLSEEHGPHAAMAIVVRVNPVGREAFLAKTPVPVGTVVVKEKMLDEKKVAVGTMTKRDPGYDPENGDWEYGYRELKKDAPAPVSGKIDSCIACHRIAKEKDYLYRPYLPK